jgi:hypothetical protein
MSEPTKPRPLTIFLFVGVLSVFLFIANWVVYEALVNIFAINTSWQLIALSSLLVFLSGSLVISSVVGMRYYNVFTRLYSLFSSVWIGFFAYLFLFSVLYGLLLMLPVEQSSNIGKIFILCALAVSIYGIFHARKIYTVEIQVPIHHLPSSWKNRKAIWISDLHLGQIHSTYLARKIVEKINTLPHDIIFIGGDLYDGTTAPDIHKLIAPLKELSAPQGIYFITGNHEEFGNSGKFISAIKSIGIEVLQDRMVTIDGLQLIGVDYLTASNKEQFKKILFGLSLNSSMASILLKHEPKDLDVALDAGISFQISGHTHRAQLWPLEYVASFVYKGFAYGLKMFGDMQVYTSSGVGTWGPPMRVGTNNEIVIFNFS